MKTVRATDANRQFSAVLKKVSQGEEFVVVSRGKPVATISPVRASAKTREAARDRLLKRLGRQTPSGSRRWTRDELYETNS